MSKAKAKRYRERLEQIKELAAQEQANAGEDGSSGHALAEEAAGLGLELADMLEEAK